MDVTLRRKSTGELLDMGSGYDEASTNSFTDAFERDQQSDPQVRDNRRLLNTVMTQAGFANYPYEWWHYDWGTQMWLQNSGLYGAGQKAWYGPGQLP